MMNGLPLDTPQREGQRPAFTSVSSTPKGGAENSHPKLIYNQQVGEHGQKATGLRWADFPLSLRALTVTPANRAALTVYLHSSAWMG